MNTTNKTILIIMDGWGIGQVPTSDAIAHAKTPFVDQLYKEYPNAQLITCGEDVGLPSGQMGNSEVGHLNLGAGRIVYQELQRINVAIQTGALNQDQNLLNTFNYCLKNQKALHLIGLVSDGGVHAHINHLIALIDAALAYGLHKIFIHAFTDGRDTDPKSGLKFLTTLQNHIEQTPAKIASITGRYFAMDRDKRWERVQKAYDAMVLGKGKRTEAPLTLVEEAYNRDETDEFIEPIISSNAEGSPIAVVNENDAVICFNFRTDRCREITEVLTQIEIPEFHMKPLNLHYTTFTEYDASYKDIYVIFRKDNLSNTIGEVIARAGLSQIRIAETEKYPHVTFFFSGGREIPFENERRLMVASPKDVPTYDLKPEMSANEITASILPEIRNQSADFIVLNFANADMVGHTGDWDAAVTAAETVDFCVSKIVPEALENGYTIFLTADHGNSDYLINEDGTSNTAHSLNPVPLFVISNTYGGLVKNGKLGDIAPSILHFMNIPIPSEMTGNILID